MPALDAEGFHGIGHHHAGFGVGLDARRTDGVGIELHELAEPARARLFVAVDITDAIGAIGQLDLVDILRDVTGHRRRQVIAQAHPLLVIILNGENTSIGAIGIGQELAQTIGIFKGRCLNRIKAMMLVDSLDFSDHVIGSADVIGSPVHKSARQAGLELVGLFIFCHDWTSL